MFRKLVKIPKWCWIVLALALRVAFALKLGGGRFYQIDESAFDSAAWRLAQTGSFDNLGHPVVIAPIPPAFFALFYIFGHHPILPRLGQAVIGTLTAWMIGKMTWQLADSPEAGRLALATSAVYPFFIYYNGLLLSETLYVAAITAGLWWFCWSLQEKGGSLWRAAGSGAALAAGTLCRSEAAPIVAVLWIVSIALCSTRRWPWKAWGAAVICWALPLAGWCARNKALTGRFALDIHGGITMLHGTVLLDLNEQDTGIAMEAAKQMPFFQQTQNLPEAERDRAYFRYALQFMREHPAETVGQWGRKLLNFWRFYPRTDKAYHETANSQPEAGLNRKTLVVISLLFEPWIILLGFAGLWELRARWEELFPLDLFLLGTMTIHMIVVSQMRYRLPVMPALILGACSWITTRLVAQNDNR